MGAASNLKFKDESSMEKQKIQERRRFFHKERVPVPTSYCYDYVMYNNGLLKDFPKKSGGNEKVIMYYLTRKFNVKDEYDNSTEFKDIAETVWMKHETISEETGLKVERISEAIKSLVSSGILLHEVKRGVGQWIALSSEAIKGCQSYCDERLKGKNGTVKSPVTETVSRQLRKPEVPSYGNRKQAVTETGSASSYIEDSVNGSREGTQKMDGWKGNQPAKVDKRVVKLVEISQTVEAVLKPKGYVDYDATNLFIADLLDKHGESEVQSWIEWLRLNLSGAKWKRGTNWLTKLKQSWDMYNVSQSDNCSPVNRRQAPKPDWSLMQRQAEEDRAANGSLDSFPF
jgi:hypothetical protein